VFRRLGLHTPALRVHAGSQIARRRADFERFSAMSRKARDWLAERGGFELPVPRILTAFKLAEKNRDRTLSSPVPVLEILSYFLLLAFRARTAEP
jgi:hypothetical protein